MSSSDKNINQEFTNQAWDQMSDLLDKEMPVKKDSNRFLFLFLCLGLVLMSGIALYNADLSASLQAEKDAHIPIAKIDATSLQVPSHEEAKATDDLSESTLMAKYNTVSQETAVAEVPTITKDVAIEDQHEVLKSIEKNTITLTKDEASLDIVQDKPTPRSSTPVSSVKVVESNPTVLLNTTFAQEEKSNQILSFELAEAIDRLPLISLEPTKRNDIILAAAPIKTEVVKFRKNIGFIMSAGAMMSTDFKFLGYGAMIKTDYNLSSKLALTAGIGLSQVNQREDAFDAMASDMLAPPGPVSSAPISKTHYGNTQQITDVMAPIALKYKLTRKASIYSGVLMRWNMEKHFRNNPARIGRPISDSDVAYNNYFINPMIGFDYKISNKIGFGLQFEKGLKSLVNTTYFPQETDKQSYLNLNFSYTL